MLAILAPWPGSLAEAFSADATAAAEGARSVGGSRDGAVGRPGGSSERAQADASRARPIVVARTDVGDFTRSPASRRRSNTADHVRGAMKPMSLPRAGGASRGGTSQED